MPPDMLVVAAFDPELARLREALRGGADRFSTSAGEMKVVPRVVGIGLPRAAAGVARLLADVEPSAVIALGTCGAYRGGTLAIGDVVVSTCVQLVDPSVLDGTSQFPAPMSLACDAEPSLVSALRLAGARPVRIATTLSITVDEATATRIEHASRAEAEHLEAYGMATACAACGIPFAAVFGVANYVGRAARDEWRAHHHVAAASAAEVILCWLRGGSTR